MLVFYSGFQFKKEEMVDYLFGKVLPLYPHRLEEYKDLVQKRAIFAPTNTEEHRLNDETMATLDGNSHIEFPVETLNLLTETPISTSGWSGVAAFS